jgi:hypothetical protein
MENIAQKTTVVIVIVFPQATDDDGAGQATVISLHVRVTDGNDNPPVFATPVYRASIDEDAVKFEPELQVITQNSLCVKQI